MCKSLHRIKNGYIFVPTNKLKHKTMKDLINKKLNQRTTEELKNDVKVAMNSEDATANIIFVLALNILEDRLNKEEYEKFEETL